MNLISRFLGRPSTRELAIIAPGELYIVRREGSPRGRREYIFRDAELMVVATSMENCYQMIVRKLMDDTEYDSSDVDRSAGDEFGGLDEREFLIDEELQLGYYTLNDNVVVTWRDLSGDPGDRYEFMCAATVTSEALDKFDSVATSGMYSRKYGHPPPKGTDMEEFNFDALYRPSQAPSGASTPVRDAQHRPSRAASGGSPVSQSAGVTGNAETVILGQGEAASTRERKERYPLSEGRIMAKGTCDLCLFDSSREIFVPQIESVTACILDQTNYKYWLEVRDADGAILGTPVDSELNPYSYPEKQAVIFNYVSATNVVLSYLLRFVTSEVLSTFEEHLAIAQWEGENRRRWVEVPQADQNYITDAFANISMRKPESESESDSEADSEAEAPEDGDYDYDMVDNVAMFTDATTEGRRHANVKNSALEVGQARDRTYVVRGNQIGVFKHTDRSLGYQTTINDLSTPDGTELDPNRVMLHDEDSALVVQGEDPNRLYKLDLEVGKVVDEWDMGKKEVQDFAPVSKFAQTTHEQTLFGVGGKSMFRIDPRLSGSKLVAGESKDYKSQTGFSVLATTESGFVVVGSNTGDIRLYDKLGRIAKTHIPSLGQAFLGMDVTADGRFVLATCRDYLLLVETVTDENNGFTKSWAKDKKPRPRKLQIQPENVFYMRQQTGKPISFTPARFNTGPDVAVESIVTSTGPYLVTWNLRAVLRGDKNAYLVKRYASDVTAENFKFGTDKRVIVALENDVEMVSKAALRKPTQSSLRS